MLDFGTESYLCKKGLVFAIRRDDLQCLAIIKCSMCKIFSSILTSHVPDWLRVFTHLPTLTFRITVEFVGSGVHKNFQFVFDVAEHFSTRFAVASYQDDPAAEFIKSRPRTKVEFAKRWISECVQTHEHCVKKKEGPLPTRVLDVSPRDDTVALRILESHGRHAYYASLSYCWGGKQPHMLTAARLPEYCKGIVESTLPQTVRDAVKVTRDIGLRYLWIDSYCIIQDCENDKHLQINQMNQIFKGSYVTIVAAGAPAVSSGFLNFDEPSPFWPLPICLSNGYNGTVLLKHWAHNTYNAEPISARAWTLQERLLSPRVLWFPSKTCMIEWQCHTLQQSDCGLIDDPAWLDSKFLLAPVFLRELRPSSPVPIHRLCYKWAEVVECYCLRTLTDPGDKLCAIGGIAAEFHRVWGGDYYAGLWGRFMLEQLLWCQNPTFNKPSTFPSRPNQYRAPSWSWASMDGKVCISRHPYLLPHQLEIVNCEITLADKAAPFGAVLAGSLAVRGLLKKGVVRESWLYDIDIKCRLGTIKMDTIERYRCLTVFCLAVGKKNDEEISASDSDCETLNSQSSYDYPGRSNGLLLLPVEDALGSNHVFRRVGIFEEFYECNNLEGWFDDCTIQEIIIV